MNDTKHTSYLTDKIGRLPFCPGCGHKQILESLDKALVSLQIDPRKIVIVTDIGCIGLSDRYFITNAFHGLHGRSITYACGIKLARPELTVVVLKGDGGCGIGGTHLLNVARRNIGITVLIANNFNYGMTGGQHSVTTPNEGITSTTPFGNIERPMDLCGTAIAAGASRVYRTTVFEPDFVDYLVQAISFPGFAMLDIWELCTAYYSPRNKLKRSSLIDLIKSYDFKLGLLIDKQRPEYSEQYNTLLQATRKINTTKPVIKKSYTHTLKKQTGIIIAGSAGQKIISTATILAKAAMHCGLEATQKDDYPITVMTGHSVAELILSPEKINYTAIDTADYVIIVSEDGLKRILPKLNKLSKNSIIFANDSLELPETNAKIVPIDFNKLQTKGRFVSLAMIAIIILIEKMDLFPVKALKTTIKAFQKKDISETNCLAMDYVLELLGNQNKIIENK